MITLTTGTAFIMWLGEQITERGIGNGISLIIFAGIVADMPDAVVRTVREGADRRHRPRSTWPSSALVIVAVVAVIVFFERGQRRIPVQYAKRVGRPEDVRRPVDAPAAQGEHRRRHPADLRLVDPDVPAADRVVRADRRGCSDLARRCTRATGATTCSTSALIVFFCYFYTAVTFNPVDVADNMKKHGGFIPGIRPGKQTAEYIDAC